MEIDRHEEYRRGSTQLRDAEDVHMTRSIRGYTIVYSYCYTLPLCIPFYCDNPE